MDKKIKISIGVHWLFVAGWDIPWEPGSQAHTKCWQKFTCFCHKFDRKVFSAKWSKKFLSNKCFPAERRDFLVQKYYHKQTFSSGRNVFTQKEITCHKKFFLYNLEIYCHRMNFHVTINSLYSKKVFTWRNCMTNNFPSFWKRLFAGLIRQIVAYLPDKIRQIVAYLPD